MSKSLSVSVICMDLQFPKIRLVSPGLLRNYAMVSVAYQDVAEWSLNTTNCVQTRGENDNAQDTGIKGWVGYHFLFSH